MRRVLFVQGSIDPPGGGNGVGAWMLHALAPDHDVTLLCRKRPDFEAVDAYYGTQLTARPPQVRVVQQLLSVVPGRLRFLRGALLQRTARRIAPRFALVLGADSEADLGERGFQYVHSPTEHLTRPVRDLPIWRTSRPAGYAHTRAIERLTGYDVERMRRAPMLANSAWTARWIERVHGVTPTVLYPPAAGVFPEVPWDRRDDAVVNVGRFSDEKRHDRVIEIVERARQQGALLRLTLVASTWNPTWERRIRALAATRPWVTIHTDVSREALCALLARHRYGLHAMEDEHFGMAPAELVRAGCVTFVHGSGGPLEIVGADPRLTWRTPEEAATRLATVARSAVEQEALREVLEPLRDRYRPARFCEAFRTIVGAAPLPD